MGRGVALFTLSFSTLDGKRKWRGMGLRGGEKVPCLYDITSCVSLDYEMKPTLCLWFSMTLYSCFIFLHCIIIVLSHNLRAEFKVNNGGSDKLQ